MHDLVQIAVDQDGLIVYNNDDEEMSSYVLSKARTGSTTQPLGSTFQLLHSIWNLLGVCRDVLEGRLCMLRVSCTFQAWKMSSTTQG
jgi:hypothetical protein